MLLKRKLFYLAKLEHVNFAIDLHLFVVAVTLTRLCGGSGGLVYVAVDFLEPAPVALAPPLVVVR